jgi:hypothetical protein
MLELVLAKLKVVIYQLAIIMLFDIYIALGEAATNAKGIVIVAMAFKPYRKGVMILMERILTHRKELKTGWP